MPTTEKTRLIISAFNRNNEEEISGYSIKELKEAIIDLGWMNKADRMAIQFRVDELEKTGDRKHHSYTRAVSYIATLAIGIIAGYVAAKL